jgi:SAM-dependent methyltransferase
MDERGIARELSMMSGQEHRSRIMHKRWTDGARATERYRRAIVQFSRPGLRVLHAGCGWDLNAVSAPLVPTCRVIGIDLDAGALARYHSPRACATLAVIPFPDSSFDLVLCEYVIEHLDDPLGAFQEIARVLRPNGRLLGLTPNAWSYKGVGAMWTPQWFHETMGRLRYGPGHEKDMYPTLYGCNTASRLKHTLSQAGFVNITVNFINNGPTWFAKLPGLFALGNLYHILLDRFESLRSLRCALLVEAVR